jgi:hypothetical protein
VFILRQGLKDGKMADDMDLMKGVADRLVNQIFAQHVTCPN